MQDQHSGPKIQTLKLMFIPLEENNNIKPFGRLDLYSESFLLSVPLKVFKINSTWFNYLLTKAMTLQHSLTSVTKK